MDIHHHIVSRAPRASEQAENKGRETDVEILDAWLWPTPAANPAVPDSRRDAVSVEMSLLPPTRRLLRDFPLPGLEEPYLRHLEQRIARNPRDLVSHVRRVYLANALNDRESITGALIDLFLVLDRHGLPLRRRLLRLVAARLTEKETRFFEAHLKKAIDKDAPVLDSPRSRLSRQLLGTTRIVNRGENREGEPVSAVLLARDSRGRGRHDLAQAVLEGALESDPGNIEVCEELLQLYSDRGLRRSFSQTYTALLGRKLACRERWDELAETFELRDAMDG